MNNSNIFVACKISVIMTAPLTMAYLVSCALVLCYSLGVLAALGGREFCNTDLSVTGTHGQS